jgi:hypothetical protein
MGQDVSLEIAGEISGAKVFGSSDNIRHGRYRFLIKKIFAELVETDAGKNKFAFWEFRVLKAEPNPQTEGDRDSTGKLIDDGNKPNAVGTDCAMKVNFDGPGGRSAGSNIKRGILALFNKNDGEIDDSEINKTWIDLARRKGVKSGDMIGFDATNNKPLYATEDKVGNPACGMIIDCYTMAKRKKKANDKGTHITKLIFTCAFPIGQGENAPNLVAQRRAEIEATMADDDDEDTTTAPASGASSTIAGAPTVPQPATAPGYNLPSTVTAPVVAPVVAAAPPPPAPPAPPVPPAAFVPQAPWVPHPSQPMGATPDTRWYWSNPALPGGNNNVKNESQLRSGQ